MIDHIWVPFLPPSSNNIYEPRWVGGSKKPKGVRLTTAAGRFKIKAMQHIQQKGRTALIHLKEDVPYELHLAVFFEEVENKTWAADPKAKTAKGKERRRFKRIDVSNRVKLIEDTTAEAVGLDDCHNFRIVLEKHCDPENPGIYVTLREVPETEVGLAKEEYDATLRLHQPERDRAGSSMPSGRGDSGPSRDLAGGDDRSSGREHIRRRFLRRSRGH